MSSNEKIKFMTYNVWSNEHVAVYRRIQAISDLISRHEPHVIFLQEVTEYICSIFEEDHWWTQYKKFSSKDKNLGSSCWSSTTQESHFCLLLSKLNAGAYECQSLWSPPPRAAATPPGLLSAMVYKPFPPEHPHVEFGPAHRVCAATCRLVPPTPTDVGAAERRASAALFLEHFDVHGHGDVVLGGDFSWDEDLDGPLRLGPGWVDAWEELRGGGGGGWTYDVAANPMLKGWRKPEMRKRPDRFLCMLRDFKLDRVEMVGVEPIPGVTHCDDTGNVLPVLPSHHFGLLLTIAPQIHK
uniref:Endonuclease/exonuclease/phosphatase domain-containing protein n=1 Tax=Oryza meridionalis TaxID=40149 RepID=A0A0E0D1N1_9ORYZ